MDYAEDTERRIKKNVHITKNSESIATNFGKKNLDCPHTHSTSANTSIEHDTTPRCSAVRAMLSIQTSHINLLRMKKIHRNWDLPSQLATNLKPTVPATIFAPPARIVVLCGVQGYHAGLARIVDGRANHDVPPQLCTVLRAAVLFGRKIYFPDKNNFLRHLLL